jgi:hypothetical protein
VAKQLRHALLVDQVFLGSVDMAETVDGFARKV